MGMDEIVDISLVIGLLYWEIILSDMFSVIKWIKVVLCECIKVFGCIVEEVIFEIEEFLRVEVEGIKVIKFCGEEVWFIIDFVDIENGMVSEEVKCKIYWCGCFMICGYFDCV